MATRAHGTVGRRVQARVNAFELNWSTPRGNVGYVYHYDAIQPLWDVGGRDFKIGKNKGTELLMRLQEVIHPEIFSPLGAYDGKKNLFSFQQYQITAQQFTVPWEAGQPRRPKDVAIMVVFVKQIDVGSLRNLLKGDPRSLSAEGDAAMALNMLNLYVQSTPKMQDPRIHNAKSFFTPIDKRASDKIRPVELWRGYFQSVRPTFDRLLINIDVTVGVVIPKGRLEQICADYLRVKNMRDMKRAELGKLRLFLKGVKVEVDLPGHAGKRPRTIKDVVANVGDIYFEKSGDRVSVADHFKRAHGRTIRPDSLGVKIGQDGLFPVDVCRTIQQLLKSRASPEIVREALDFSPPDPRQRLGAIRAGWQQLCYTQSPFLLGAGISVKPNPVVVNGRLLPSPGMTFFDKKDIIPLAKPGQWDVMKRKLKSPSNLSNWIVVDFAGCEMRVLITFVMDLRQAMTERGMIVNQPHNIVRKSPHDGVATVLDALGREAQAEMILVILPESAAEIYREVKRFGDITIGVVTQCVKWSGKLSRDAQNQRCNQYHNNLILKINAKLGGTNYQPVDTTLAELTKLPAMILGADVSHPGPGSMLPSIASLVASMDNGMLRYVASIRVQETRTEIIQDLSAMFKSALATFHQRNNILPARIIMFRDGVSEGEFLTVKDQEITAMKTAIREVYPINLQPKLTFLVVGKRHHFRFFPMDDASTDSRGNGNLYPGFVVDQDIVHPVFRDFYLQSQPGLKGTSRPSHYTVLKNEIDIPIDGLQQLAYALCHCYSRATRSVKIPAPVYYADLVCRRAKFHFDDKVRDDASSEHSDEKPHLDFYKEHFEAINIRLKDMMYFV